MTARPGAAFACGARTSWRLERIYRWPAFRDPLLAGKLVQSAGVSVANDLAEPTMLIVTPHFVVTAHTAPASIHPKQTASKHQEWREGPDPMTARQPGEGRQGAKVSPETGTMWRTTAQPTAAFLDLPSAPRAHWRNFFGQNTKEVSTAVRSRIARN